ncbi:MAG: hypothetical protein KAJ73_03780, partial [Zetaproteobacteria bacterium]|nr:hypothetical protein [Zetaproteobacteria bacterium]
DSEPDYYVGYNIWGWIWIERQILSAHSGVTICLVFPVSALGRKQSFAFISEYINSDIAEQLLQFR